MSLPFLFVLALQVPSTQTPADPPAFEAIPVSASTEFAHLVYRIQDLIAAKDFEGASKLAKFLPSSQLEIAWDESKVPVANRVAFQNARNSAIDNFKFGFPTVSVKLVSGKARLKVDFEKELATPPNSTFPAGSTHFYSEDPKDPYLEAVIGLNRGRPLVATTVADVFNDVSRAMGAAMGLSTTPFYGGVMAGSDLPSAQRYDFALGQKFSVKGLIKLSDNLRDLIAKKISLPSGKPSLHVETQMISAGEVFTGDVVPLAVQITNNGDAPLNYSAKGDCGCIVVREENVLMPGQSWIIRGSIDTLDVKGPLKHNIELVSNDPDHPALAVPVEATIRTRYDLIPDFPDGLTAKPDGTAKFGVTLKFAPGAKRFRVRESAVVGIRGKVVQKELVDSSGQVTGYRFDATLPAVQKGGPFVSELNILTDDENIKIIRYPEHIVNGIVALPGTLYLGSDLQGTREFRVDVIAPGFPFKIKSATCTIPAIKATVYPVPNIGYKIKLAYDGKLAGGPFEGQLLIDTDNPKQPHFEIQITGVAKG